MKPTASFLCLAVAAAALLLTACGGGGGGADPAGGVTLKGAVVLRDGTTQNLGGILIRELSTGATVATSSTGAFNLGSVPAGTVGLRVIDPLTGTSLRLARGTGGTSDTGGADDPPGHDDQDDVGNDGDDDEDPDHDLNDDDGSDGDDDDAGDDDFDLSGVDDGDTVEVEIEIRNGRIERVSCSQSRFNRQRSEVALTRTDVSDDLDATGKARLEARSDRQKFNVEAEDLASGRSLELFVIDTLGAAESQGLRTVDAFGEAEWELNTNDGARLPFAVSTVAELEGFTVEVRDGVSGLVLLRGVLPALPDLVETPDGGSGSGSGDDDELGRSRLTRAAGAVGEAYVELRSREDRERFEAEVEHQTGPMTVEVWLANPATGVLTLVGSMNVGAFGEAELELDTHDGDALPFGVATAAELAGLAVELRNAAGGAVLFSGTTPDLVAH